MSQGLQPCTQEYGDTSFLRTAWFNSCWYPKHVTFPIKLIQPAPFLYAIYRAEGVFEGPLLRERLWVLSTDFKTILYWHGHSLLYIRISGEEWTEKLKRMQVYIKMSRYWRASMHENEWCVCIPKLNLKNLCIETNPNVYLTKFILGSNILKLWNATVKNIETSKWEEFKLGNQFSYQFKLGKEISGKEGRHISQQVSNSAGNQEGRFSVTGSANSRIA